MLRFIPVVLGGISELGNHDSIEIIYSVDANCLIFLSIA